jgi:hypothetical protein
MKRIGAFVSPSMSSNSYIESLEFECGRDAEKDQKGIGAAPEKRSFRGY